MRLFLTFMTTHGNEENLRELVEPVKHLIDGIIATFHYPKDNGADYLESVKGLGKIIYRDWISRHDISMNETFWCGILQEGDLVCAIDTLERASPNFLTQVRGELDKLMVTNGVDCISYYGKAYIFRYNEFLNYQGSPHWGLRGLQGKMVEYSQIEPDESKVRLNVRPQKRTDPYNWVSHYQKYYLYPPGSNAVLLGLELLGDPAKLFPVREMQRLRFRKEMVNRSFPLTLSGVKQMLSGPIDETLKGFINGEKIIGDFYQYEILGNKNVIHSHLPSDMIKI